MKLCLLIGLIVTITIFYHSECRWIRTTREEFCDNVMACYTRANHQVVPVNDGQHLSDKEIQTLCPLAEKCDLTGSSGSTSDTSLENSDIDSYLISTNKAAFCTIVEICNSKWNEEDRGWLEQLKDIPHYCPYVDYCRFDASLTISEPGNVSCCVSCSCDRDCGFRHDCCFPYHDDKYNAIETEEMSCVSLKMPHGFRSIFMLDKCPNDTECFQNGSLIQPVSSAITKRIYINIACAKCNSGLDDSAFIPWSMAVERALGSNNIDNDMALLNCFIRPDECVGVYTIPDAHWLWVKHFSCGEKYVDTCSDPENEALLELCETIHAPVTTMVTPSFWFQNIFCLLCWDPEWQTFYTPTDVCYQEANDDPRSLSMLMLLDMDVLYARQDEVCLDSDNSHKEQRKCRQVLCPEWMVRVDGTCVYLTKKWIHVGLTYQLILRPSQPIDAALFRNMTQRDQVYVETWLFNECGFDFKTESSGFHIKMYMLPVRYRNKSIVKEFLLRIDTNHKSLNPATYIPFLKRCLNRRWKMIRLGKTFYLSASFYPYRSFMPDGETKRNHVSLNGKYSEIPLPKLYEPITIPWGVFRHGFEDEYLLPFQPEDISTTKLLFCERTQVFPDEIDLLYGQIRINETGRVLSDGEFDAQYDVIDGDKTLMFVHICVEDLKPIVANAGIRTGEHAVGILFLPAFACSALMLLV